MEMRAADARPERGERLEGLQGRYGAMVRQIVRRGRLEDREAAEAEVWARVWGALPRMVERERGKAAAGRDDQSRCNAEIEGRREHRWGAWIARIAKRLVIDEKRRDEVARRAYGERAVRGAPEDREEVDLDV